MLDVVTAPAERTEPGISANARGVRRNGRIESRARFLDLLHAGLRGEHGGRNARMISHRNLLRLRERAQPAPAPTRLRTR